MVAGEAASVVVSWEPVHNSFEVGIPTCQPVYHIVQIVNEGHLIRLHDSTHACIQYSLTSSKSSRIFSQPAMPSVSYSGEGYAVVEGVEGDVFNFLFVNSKDSEILEVEAHILRRTGKGRNEISCSFPNVLCRWIIYATNESSKYVIEMI